MFALKYAKVPSKSLKNHWNTYSPMHTWPSEDDLPPQKRQVLLAMWKARAIGDRTISLRDLKARLPDEVKVNYISHLKNLKEKLFIQISHANNQDAASITPLGLAFIRQIQDDDFRLLTGERGSTK